ncbi:MAG: YMGG-like glycine zipper-containing protein [Pyrinomonadaceae bacterium MAG19_C2-C3]|nr:YMGG-like glycine zipper-containing protein [Pyrinomonadaceae bacterium MAG19_C2-C3]
MKHKLRNHRFFAAILTAALIITMLPLFGSTAEAQRRRYRGERRGTHSKTKGALIGGGIGAVGGALLGGGKGALIGGGAGAGTGYLIQRQRNKNQRKKYRKYRRNRSYRRN